MAFTDEIKKTVTDATPVYAVVGVTDAAAEKLRECPYAGPYPGRPPPPGPSPP